MQPQQDAQEVQAVEVGALSEEPFQEEPLSQNAVVRAVSEEELRSALGLEESREAVSWRGHVEVLVRNHVFAEGQAVRTRGAVRGAFADA